MRFEEIKNKLLEDREFREKLFQLYYEDNNRFINKVLKEASGRTDTSNN